MSIHLETELLNFLQGVLPKYKSDQAHLEKENFKNDLDSRNFPGFLTAAYKATTI